MVYQYPIISLFDLKESIERHVRNIPHFMLLSTVEHAILLFQMVADNGRRHIKHVLYTFVDYLYVLNKAMKRHLGVVLEIHFSPSIKFPLFHSAITQFSCNSAA